MKGRRPGISLVELLIALPLGLIIAGAVLQVMFLSVETFERNLFYSYNPCWQGAERIFAFLDVPLKYCGVGLPENWEMNLFSSTTTPTWSTWRRPLSVGNTVDGVNYRTAGNDWGNTLRIVAGPPSGIKLIRTLTLESGAQTTAYMTGPVKSDSTVGLATSVSWLLFPGVEVPVRMTASAGSSTPKVLARADAEIPWGTPVCRLLAMLVFMKDGALCANFNDNSGAQPLVRDVEDVQFRLDASGKILTVKVILAETSGAVRGRPFVHGKSASSAARWQRSRGPSRVGGSSRQSAASLRRAVQHGAERNRRLTDLRTSGDSGT